VLVSFIQAYVFRDLTCVLSERRKIDPHALHQSRVFLPDNHLNSIVKEKMNGRELAQMGHSLAQGLTANRMVAQPSGVGNVAATTWLAYLRTPSAAAWSTATLFMRAALWQKALGISRFLVALLLMFACLSLRHLSPYASGSAQMRAAERFSTH